jgi:parallel beta-helix repeat protein
MVRDLCTSNLSKNYFRFGLRLSLEGAECVRGRNVSTLLVVLVVLSSFSALVTILPENARAVTLFVGGIGPGNYTTIQSAIDAANPGENVYVYNGTYYENVIVNKTLNLVGENRNSTIIDGNGTGDSVTVTEDWVNLTGFHMEAGLGNAGIWLYHVTNCNVSFNNARGSSVGILIESSDDNHVNNNTISNNSYGIYLEYSDNIILSNNTISNSTSEGLVSEWSNESTIVGNTVAFSRLSGMEFWLTNDSIISDNNLSSNRYDGLEFYECSNNSVFGNYVSSNRYYGINMDFSGHFTITDNELVENGLSLGGDLLEHWNTHVIDVTNTVNGKPLYYWKNMTGGTVPLGAGEIILANSTGVNVNNQTLYNCSVGIELGFSHGNTIVDNNISNNTLRFGVYSWDSDDNVYVDNDFFSTRMAIWLELSDNNTIGRNTIDSSLGGGIILGLSDFNNVTGNNVSGSGYALNAQLSIGISVVSNNFSNNEHGLYLAECDNCTVSFNALDNQFYEGIKYVASNGGIIENNNLSDSPFGMYIEVSVRNLIANNTFDSNGEYGIICPQRCSNNSIMFNDFLSNGETGLILGVDSNNNLVIGNNVSDNLDGIILRRSNINTIDNNTISRNLDSGISIIEVSSYNTVINNTISNNSWGMKVNSTTVNNAIYHNEFIDNQNQARDLGSNFWDDGYPSGGNYWSDYTGLDQFSGPNQDIPGSDGIGDTPYPFDFSQDNYPLLGIPSNLTAPSAPQNLSASAGDQKVILTWDAPVFDGNSSITNYRIFRGPSPGTELLLAEIGNVLTYTDTFLLTNGQTEYYFVTAKNAIGEGPPSNEVNATPTSIPGTPFIRPATLGGGNHEHVSVNWFLSFDDGSGQNSVVEYRIYRNTTFDVSGAGYGLIASVPNGTSEFIDNLAGEGDPNNYFYRVCAVDLNNQSSCAQKQEGKFTQSLSKGLALVSYPLHQLDSSLEVVLQTVSYDKAWSYDFFFQEWTSFAESKPYSASLLDAYFFSGLWINVTEESNFTVAGMVPGQSTIQLSAGWNLVGFPSFNTTYAVAELKQRTGATRVEGFDPSTSPYNLKALQDTDVLQTGQGYWIYVPTWTIWVVNIT